MKRAIAFLLCCCIVCCFSVTVLAETLSEGETAATAVISVTVPDSHKITVLANGAEVFFEGVAKTEFSAERLTEPTVLIRANSGKTVKQVLLNGEDVTSQIKGGYYKFDPVYEDKTLTIITENEVPPAQTKTYTVRGTVTQNGEPIAGVTLELRSTVKTAVTDNNGKFSFSDVECGKHSLTAIKDGKITGYLEFVLNESYSADFRIEDNGIYTVTANRNEVGVDLVLDLTDSGALEIKNVSEIREEKGSPQTGDESSMFLWIILLIISGTVVGMTTFVKRKKYYS